MLYSTVQYTAVCTVQHRHVFLSITAALIAESGQKNIRSRNCRRHNAKSLEGTIANITAELEGQWVGSQREETQRKFYCKTYCTYRIVSRLFGTELKSAVNFFKNVKN